MSDKSYKFVLSFLLMLFLLVFYSRIILEPNTYVFTLEGDSIKNIYVFLNYVKNSASYFELDQMNYPYGESVLFTDCQLAFSLPWKLLCNVFPGLSNYTLAYFNLLLIASFFVSAIIIYNLLELFNHSKILSLLGALGIVILSPQVLRLDGHFSLSYIFFLPFTLWYIFRKAKGLKAYDWAAAIVLLLAYFTHAYLGLMCSGLVILFFLLHFLFLKKKKGGIMSTIFSLGVGILPLLVFYFSSVLLDSHTGRTTNPWGFFEYNAEIESVFIPFMGFLKNFSHTLLKPGIIEKEGASYIGFSTILSFVIGLLSFLIGQLLLRKKVFLNRLNPALIILFFVGIIFLLFSMLYPFRWGFEEPLDWFPIIKQFRAVGRFAWPFYYITTILGIVIIGEISTTMLNSSSNRKKDFAYLMIFLFPGLLIAEGIGYHEYNANIVPEQKSPFLKKHLSADLQEVLQNVPDEEYQAFIPLPFFHLGSENYDYYKGEIDYSSAFQFNYFTQIPMVANMSSRTSIWEAKRIMQLFSNPYYEKAIKADFPNEKPLLVLFKKSHVSSEEYRILNLSEMIVGNESYYLGSIRLEDIFQSNHTEVWNEYLAIKDQLYPKYGFLVSDTNALIKYHDFGIDKPISFDTSSNSYAMKNEEMIFLGNILEDEGKLGKTYRTSFWIYNEGENFGQDQSQGHFFYDKVFDQKSHWFGFKRPGENFQINKNWTLVESDLIFSEPIGKHLIIFKKDTSLGKTTYLKDLLLYEKGLEVYKEMEIDGMPYLFYNNHRIPKYKKDD